MIDQSRLGVKREKGLFHWKSIKLTSLSLSLLLFILISGIFIYPVSADSEPTHPTLWNVSYIEGNYSNISEFISDVGNGDTIRIWGAEGHTYEGGFTIDDPNVLIKQWDGSPTRPLITKSSTGRAVYIRSDNVTLQSLNISGNVISGDGAGVAAVGSAVYPLQSLTITNCTFVNNTVSGPSGHGGALHILDVDNVLITYTTFEDNGGDCGGAAYFRGSDNVTLTSTNFSRNAAVSLGGGACFWLVDHVILTNTTLLSNTAISGSGGGAYIGGTNFVTMTEASIESNTANGGNSGGISFSDSDHVFLTRATFENNTAYSLGGGAEFSNSENVTLTDLAFYNNTARHTSGGGVGFWSNSHNITLTGITLRYNTADLYGGGAYFSVTDYASVTNTTISNNMVQRYGGGVYFEGSENATLTNTTLENNTAAWTGGGAYFKSSLKAVIKNCLFNNLNNLYAEGSEGARLNETTTILETNILGGLYLGGNAWLQDPLQNISETCTDANLDGICDDSLTTNLGTDFFPLVYNRVIAPTITSISPSSSVTGSSVSITNLVGTGFLSGATVELERSGETSITGTNVDVVSSTQITCDFDLSGAATGAWDVNVTNSDGGTVTETGLFTVSAVPISSPTITSISPSSSVTGNSVSITNLAGTGFLSGATIELERTGETSISGTNVDVVSSTQITCDFDLSGAATGVWDVNVTNSDGGTVTGTGLFTVTAVPISSPTITSISPSSSVTGSSASITNLVGTGFVSGVTVELERSGETSITGTNVDVVSSTQITCNFDLSGAATGAWDVNVTNTDGGTVTETGLFTVSAASTTSGEYTISWAGSPESVVPNYRYRYNYSIAYDGDDDPENVLIMIQLDDDLTYVSNTISLVDQSGNLIDGGVYPSSQYAVSYDEYTDSGAGLSAVQTVIRESQNQFHYNEDNHVLVGSFDKLFHKNDKNTDHIEGEIIVNVKKGASGTIINNLTLKDKNQLVNTFYGGIGFNPDNPNDLAGRLRTAFLFDATLRYSYGIDEYIGNSILHEIYDVAKAGANQYTQDNYLGTDEGDGTYSIAFSHSGGTQTLYQKIVNENVRCEYAVFISPALIYQGDPGDVTDGWPITLAEARLLGWEVAEAELETLTKFLYKRNQFSKLFENSVDKVVIVWSKNDILNRMLNLQNRDGYTTDGDIITDKGFYTHSDYIGVNYDQADRWLGILSKVGWDVRVHSELVERSIGYYTNRVHPFDKLTNYEKPVLPENQELEISSLIVSSKTVSEYTPTLNVPRAKLERGQIIVDTTGGGIEKEGENVIKVTKNDGTVIKFNTGNFIESGGYMAGELESVEMIPPTIEGYIDESVGSVDVDVSAVMDGYEDGASIDIELSAGAPEDARNAFSLAQTRTWAWDDISEYAYSLSFTKNGFDEVSLNSVTLTLSVSKDWVDSVTYDHDICIASSEPASGRGYIKLYRWKDDGVVEALPIINSELIGDKYLLTFNTDGFSLYSLVAVTPSETSASTSTSSSGSGLPSSTTDAGSAENVKSGEIARISINGDDTAITSLCLLTNTDCPSVLLTTEKISSLPSTVCQADCPVYQYIEIKPYKIESDSISQATISFTMPKSWLTTKGFSTDEIVMLHYDDEANEWLTMATTFTGEDGSLLNYEAVTESFSYFAIAGQKGPVSSDVDTSDAIGVPDSSEKIEPTVASDVSENGDDKKDSVPVINNDGILSFSPLILVIIGIMLPVAGGVLYLRKKRREQYPDWWFDN